MAFFPKLMILGRLFLRRKESLEEDMELEGLN
jgi:hypothetical protein